MSEVDIKIDPKDLASLNSAMARFQRETPADQAFALRKGMAKVIVSMRSTAKHHKRAARARDVIKNPAASGAKFLIVVRHQNKQDTYIPTNKRGDKRRRVKAMGFAASSFTHSLKRLGRGVGPTGGKTVSRSRNYQRVDSRLRGSDQFVRLQNTVSYMQDRYPRIVEEAIPKGARALEKELDDRIDRRFKKVFGV